LAQSKAKQSKAKQSKAKQRGSTVGARVHVLFGKNEGGGQLFHQWVDTLLETPHEDFPELFQRV